MMLCQPLFADMALKSTIFKVQLSVADIDHGYYADHAQIGRAHV